MFHKILARTTSKGSEEAFAPITLLLASQFLLFIGVGAFIPSIPLYIKVMRLSGTANGIVISMLAVALFLALDWNCRIADIA